MPVISELIVVVVFAVPPPMPVSSEVEPVVALPVKEMAPLVLPHRLVLKAESELRGRTAPAVVVDILQRTAVDLGVAS